MIRFHRLVALCLASCAAISSTAQAHFPWLVRNADGSVELFFGEGLNDRTYKLPPSIAAAEVFSLDAQGEPAKIEMQSIEQDAFVGLKSEKGKPFSTPLYSKVTFGIYHGSRLDYYTLHLGDTLPKSQDVYKPLFAHLELMAQVVDTDTGIDVTVTYMGKPLEAIDVRLFGEDGEENGTAKTDAEGLVTFSNQQVTAGLNGLMLGKSIEQAGTLKDTPYTSASHYMTATFYNEATTAETQATQAATLPPLPFEITSFGAVRHGDAIYVYGGHTGDAHSYSNEAQSDKLLKLDLRSDNPNWQVLSTGPRLQGLGMVAHGDRVILVGGFTALNKEGDDHDLHSQASVLAFNLKSGEWSELPALPEARSSHDAALIGDTVYVVGGWKMDGDETTWHKTALAMDLSATQPAWKEVANPPFARRALATVEHGGKLFVLGGMNEKGGPTKAVAIYDPASNQWSDAPELLGEEAMAGFGAAGWSIDEGLIVTTYEGDIQRWNDQEHQWLSLGKAANARFFHRLLPLDGQHLVSLGGANMEEGKFLDLEVIAAE